MVHIETFQIEQFRGIRQATFEHLGQINLLIGENNSGKTSALEALSIFGDPWNWRSWHEIASSREVFAGIATSTMPRLSLVDRWTWLFPQYVTETPNSSAIVLRAMGALALQRVEAHYERFQTIEQAEEKRLPIAGIDEIEVENLKVDVTALSRPTMLQLPGFEGDVSFSEQWVFSEQRTPRLTKKKPALPTQLITPFAHRLSSLQPRLWTSVVEAGLKAPTLELLRSYDPQIEDVDLLLPNERQLLLSIKHQKLGRAPLSTFGDGLRRVFTLATAIPQCRHGFLLIDEIETAIHTKALRKTFKWLVDACIQHDVQLFATTHSIETIDAIITASKRDEVDLVAYRLEQKDEKIRTTRLDKGLLTRLREDLGLEVRS